MCVRRQENRVWSVFVMTALVHWFTFAFDPPFVQWCVPFQTGQLLWGMCRAGSLMSIGLLTPSSTHTHLTHGTHTLHTPHTHLTHATHTPYTCHTHKPCTRHIHTPYTLHTHLTHTTHTNTLHEIHDHIH